MRNKVFQAYTAGCDCECQWWLIMFDERWIDAYLILIDGYLMVRDSFSIDSDDSWWFTADDGIDGIWRMVLLVAMTFPKYSTYGYSDVDAEKKVDLMVNWCGCGDPSSYPGNDPLEVEVIALQLIRSSQSDQCYVGTYNRDAIGWYSRWALHVLALALKTYWSQKVTRLMAHQGQRLKLATVGFSCIVIYHRTLGNMKITLFTLYLFIFVFLFV